MNRFGHGRRILLPVEKILPSVPLSTGNAASRFLMDGWCRPHVGSGTWLWLCLSCPFKDFLTLLYCNNKSPPPSHSHRNCMLTHSTGERTGGGTYPSVCCRLCLIVLICWKWPDMSVDKTISMTRVRSSLQTVSITKLQSYLFSNETICSQSDG